MTVQQIETFKRENDLVPEGAAGEAATTDFDDEIDLRAEDDALIAAELEAEQAAAAEDDDEDEDEEAVAEDEAAEDKPKARPRRSRRGRGRGAKANASDATSFEGTFDHGEEGYGLWLDPAVEDSAVYAEHWAGHRPVEVTIEADQIVIRRTGDAGDDE